MRSKRSRKKISLTGYLSRQSNVFLVGLAVLSILLIGVYDYETGFEVGFYIFYLAPVCLVTWYVNTWAGLAMCFFSAYVWLAADVLSGFHYSHPLVPYWNAVMRSIAFVILVIFLSKLKSAFDVQKRLSRTDHLTGITNRAAFLNHAAFEIERARRHKRPLTAAFVDIDNFKSINDQFGHKKGDKVLKLVAETIQGNIRTVDIAARFGGDEFVLLLPETNAASSAVLFRRLKERLMQAVLADGFPATFSFGVATFLDAPSNAEEMIARTDKLMYEAKRGGKNMIRQEIFHKNPSS